MDKDATATRTAGKGLFWAALLSLAVLVTVSHLALRNRGVPDAEKLAALVPEQPTEAAPDPIVTPTPAVPTPEQTEVSPDPAPQIVAEPAPETAAEAEAEPAPETAPQTTEAVPEPEAEAAVDPVADSEAQPDAEAPRIEDVRLEPDGLAVIAGRAAPGSTVIVLLDGVEVAQGMADDRGAFAAITMLSASVDARVLSLVQRDESGDLASLEEVILAPLNAVAEAPQTGAAETAPTTQTAAVETAPASAAEPSANETATPAETPAPVDVAAAETDVPGQTESAITEPAANQTAEAVGEPVTGDPAAAGITPETAAVSETGTPAGTEPGDAVTAEPAPAPGAVAVLKSTEAGVELLQPAPQVMSSVALDTISYSDVGAVQLAGRAQPVASQVRVYLNNAPVTTLQVDAQGRWRGDLPDVDTGIYTLRVDEIDSAGTVTSRMETPFKREAPAVLASATAGQSGLVKAVTVQTGDTLWAIARDRYGEGILYVRVFEANRGQIRDADLIYPGQVFDLPD